MRIKDFITMSLLEIIIIFLSNFLGDYTKRTTIFYTITFYNIWIVQLYIKINSLRNNKES